MIFPGSSQRLLFCCICALVASVYCVYSKKYYKNTAHGTKVLGSRCRAGLRTFNCVDLLIVAVLRLLVALGDVFARLGLLIGWMANSHARLEAASSSFVSAAAISSSIAEPLRLRRVKAGASSGRPSAEASGKTKPNLAADGQRCSGTLQESDAIEQGNQGWKRTA